MAAQSGLEKDFGPLIGEQVVADTKGSYIYIGVLDAVNGDSLVFNDVDVHYRGDSSTTSELYLIQTAKNGIRVNRKRVYVLTREVMSLSKLSDIVSY